MFQRNRVSMADSYKYSHADQYRTGMVYMTDFMESRGGEYPATVFIGLQAIMMDLFAKPITAKEVKRTAKKMKKHGVPFDYEGWMYIVNELGGKLPVRIKAVKEGTLVPTSNVLMTIESTDPRVPWIAGWLETVLMNNWYPITVATKAFYVKKTLRKYGSTEWSDFAYHMFGARGATCPNAAEISGMAHLSLFYGTDNVSSLDYIEEFYDDYCAGYSVWASEHSSTTSWGRENEEEFVYQQLLKNPDAPIMSFVADSYDVFNFTDFCTRPGSRIRDLVESRPHQKLVLRPDSGNPINVISKMLRIMIDNKVNVLPKDQGYDKVTFIDFAILWGDGIIPKTIETILWAFTTNNFDNLPIFAAENFVFGTGGDLTQNLTRDTQKFAIKCSSITAIEDYLPYETGIWTKKETQIDIFKDPITDPGKKSKKGRFTLLRHKETGEFKTSTTIDPDYDDVLEDVWLNGHIVREQTFTEIREIANSYL